MAVCDCVKLQIMSEPDIAFVAGLLADSSRAAMCIALAGGEARPAGELAARAGVSAQTASNHLAKLIAGRILQVDKQARTCYSHLAGRVGVALADALTAGGWLEADDRDYRLTPTGTRLLQGLGRGGPAPARPRAPA